jgi:hypothetical protein
MGKKKSALELEMVFEKDTKRMHRYKVGDYGEAVSGTLYFPKDKPIPKKIILTLGDGDED